jgi:hypothetical protein
VLRAQKEGKFTVLFDSGIRQGSDVIKAIAMGAQGVLGRRSCFPLIGQDFSLMSIAVGRPFMYGLAIGGEQGVEEVLRALLADTEVTLGLSGYKSIEEIWAKRGAVLEKESLSPTITPSLFTLCRYPGACTSPRDTPGLTTGLHSFNQITALLYSKLVRTRVGIAVATFHPLTHCQCSTKPMLERGASSSPAKCPHY